MRRILSLILAVVAMTTGHGIANGESFTLNGVNYGSLDETTVAVTSVSGDLMGPLEIPASVTNEGKTYSVTKIGVRALYGAQQITSVVLPTSITEIGDYAFCACYGMTSINLEDTKVKHLPTGAFGACWALRNVKLPATLVSMTDNPFYMPKSLVSFSVAEGNPAYKAIDGVLYTISGKTLIAYPFAKATDLKVSVAEGTDSIGAEAFMNFRDLRSCKLPESLTYIGRSSFSMCDTMSTINLPRTLKYIGGSAFHGNIMMSCKACFDEGMTSIGASAFNSTAVTEVDIPGTVKIIQKNAFWGCRNVKKIKLHEGTTRIWEMAFYNTKVDSIVLPNSLTRIGSDVFAGNYTATYLQIGSGLLDFELTSPFNGCSGLKKVVCIGSTPPSYLASLEANYPLFPANVFSTASLIVPQGSVDAYRAATGWKNFTNINTMGIGGIEDDSCGLKVENSATGVEISGVKYVDIYTVAGTKVYSGAAGHVSLERGLYIVRSGDATIKVLR